MSEEKGSQINVLLTLPKDDREQGISLRTIFFICYKSKWLILAMTLTCFISGIILAVLYGKLSVGNNQIIKFVSSVISYNEEIDQAETLNPYSIATPNIINELEPENGININELVALVSVEPIIPILEKDNEKFVPTMFMIKLEVPENIQDEKAADFLDSLVNTYATEYNIEHNKDFYNYIDTVNSFKSRFAMAVDANDYPFMAVEVKQEFNDLYKIVAPLEQIPKEYTEKSKLLESRINTLIASIEKGMYTKNREQLLEELLYKIDKANRDYNVDKEIVSLFNNTVDKQTDRVPYLLSDQNIETVRQTYESAVYYSYLYELYNNEQLGAVRNGNGLDKDFNVLKTDISKYIDDICGYVENELCKSQVIATAATQDSVVIATQTASRMKQLIIIMGCTFAGLFFAVVIAVAKKYALSMETDTNNN